MERRRDRVTTSTKHTLTKNIYNNTTPQKPQTNTYRRETGTHRESKDGGHLEEVEETVHGTFRVEVLRGLLDTEPHKHGTHGRKDKVRIRHCQVLEPEDSSLVHRARRVRHIDSEYIVERRRW